MKADERHKLRTNQLLDYLRQVPDKLRPHARLILTSLLIVLLATALLWSIQHRRTAARSQAWADLDSARAEFINARSSGEPEKLSAAADRFGRVAAAYPDTKGVAPLASYFQGMALMLEAGVNGQIFSSLGYKELIDKAADCFKKVLSQDYHPLATPGSNLELGNIAKDHLQFDEAREYYAKAASDSKGAPTIKDEAGRQLQDLPPKPDAVAFVQASRTPSTSAETPITPLPRLKREDLVPPIPLTPSTRPEPGDNTGEPMSTGPRKITTRSDDDE